VRTRRHLTLVPTLRKGWIGRDRTVELAMLGECGREQFG
jgi:hypothetical protein